MCEDPCGWGDSFEEGDGTALEAGTALQAVRTQKHCRPASLRSALGPERGHRLTDWHSLSIEILLLSTVVISENWGE